MTQRNAGSTRDITILMPEWKEKIKMRMKFQKLESYIRIDQDQEGQRGPDGSSQLRQRKESFES